MIKANFDRNATFQLPCPSLHQANTQVRNGNFIQNKALDVIGKRPFEKVVRDPTKKVEDGINRIALELFRSDRIKKPLYDYLRASSCPLPCFYGRAKIHKTNCPVRPVISSVGTATYNASLYLARILAPVVGNTEHTAKNSKEFVEHVSGLDIADDEVMVSYDVEALYTSLPLGRVLEVTREKLVANGTLSERPPSV